MKLKKTFLAVIALGCATTAFAANEVARPLPNVAEVAGRAAIQPEVTKKPAKVIDLGEQDAVAEKPKAKDKAKDKDKQAASAPPAKAGLPPLPPPAAFQPPDPLEIAKEQVMPLSPEQIIELKKSLDEARRAANQSPGTPPKPVSGSITVDLSPGTPPPVARLYPGHVTTLSFIDVTGSAWPIKRIINGDPKNFNVQVPEDDGNTATVASLGWYSVGNIAVMLEGMASPVTVTLIGGQKEVDYRLDMRIPRRGPNALPQQVVGTAKPEHNTDFLNILDGVAPKTAVPLKVEGEGQAWMLNGSVVYRTRNTLVSPAWTGKVQSSDGTYVYELPFVPVVLVSTGGAIREVRISQP